VRETRYGGEEGARWDVQERWEPQQILLEEEAKERLLP
jgi:hypothetical protein